MNSISRNLKSILLMSLFLASNAVFAGGIPVVDASAIKQAAAHNLKELAEMAKQLIEAQNQVTQLKANVKALTGDKGFSKVMEMGGVDKEILTSFDDLLSGDTKFLAEKAKKYLEDLPDCSKSKDTQLCESSSLSNIAQLDFAEKLNSQISGKLQTITELSEKIKSAKDMKSMSEIQAMIGLEANSISLIQQQANNFARLQESQNRIAAQQLHDSYANSQWEVFSKGTGTDAATVRDRKSSDDFSDLMN